MSKAKAELRPEYRREDLGTWCECPEERISLLNEEVAKAFPTTEAVNEARGPPGADGTDRTYNGSLNTHGSQASRRLGATFRPQMSAAIQAAPWEPTDREVPAEGLLKRALASDHGTGCTVPSRRAFWRLRTSSRQASEIEGSALPSRLSSTATTSAER
jgi:hypothetical protein